MLERTSYLSLFLRNNLTHVIRAIFVAISIFSRCFKTISDIESPPNREESDLTGLKREDGYNNT